MPIVGENENENDDGGQLYRPSRRGGNVDAQLYALLAQA
jgi:hypothetical protein